MTIFLVIRPYTFDYKTGYFHFKDFLCNWELVDLFYLLKKRFEDWESDLKIIQIIWLSMLFVLYISTVHGNHKRIHYSVFSHCSQGDYIWSHFKSRIKLEYDRLFSIFEHRIFQTTVCLKQMTVYVKPYDLFFVSTV